MAISEAAQSVPQLAPQLAQKVAFYALIVCWWAFALTFWLRKRPPRAREAKRDWTSLVGLFLQGIAYFCVWFRPLQRQQILPNPSASPVVEWSRGVLIVSIAVGSAWLVNTSARRLGKQWALAARLVEGHTLIQDGPYRFVRNPIYTGMLGMLVATGLATMRPLQLLFAILLFALGTFIRIRSEERLLRQAFGAEFDEYARRVPALIPGIY
ncbi:MAG: isoprenylcysteine carboxylmethyltransferase family protein [Terriglobales bacterium]